MASSPGGVRYRCGSISWRRQVLVRLANMAAVRPPRGLPTNNEFLRFGTTRLISRSLRLLSMGTLHAGRRRSTPSIGPARSSPPRPWDAWATAAPSSQEASGAVQPAPVQIVFDASRAAPARKAPGPASLRHIANASSQWPPGQSRDASFRVLQRDIKQYTSFGTGSRLSLNLMLLCSH